jgi:hypothetical protein
MLFTKEFLDELQLKCNHNIFIDYVMYSKNLTFQQAVVEIAEYIGIKPEYMDLIKKTNKRERKKKND